jgi:hypothetical protein
VPGNVDRRPWLIISAAEARALLEIAQAQPRPSEDLRRAITVLTNQLRWLHDGTGEPPRPAAAAERGADRKL